jgi:hypothetical protein
MKYTVAQIARQSDRSLPWAIRRLKKMRSANVLCALAGAASLLFTSCATTRDVQSWKDGAYQGKIKKILVVMVLSEPLMRNFIEQEFVEQFKARGIEGAASNRIVSAEMARDKEATLSFIKAQGFGTVLVTKMLDQRFSDRAQGGGVGYMPTGYGVGWDGIYNDGFLAVGLPVAQSSLDIYTMQTNVYDLQEGKLIFSAVSNTRVEDSKEKVVPAFVKTMVKQLADVTLL